MSNKVKFSEELKAGLRAIFGIDPVDSGTGIRIHVKEIGGQQLLALATLILECDGHVNLNLRRSGTGITILIFN